MPTKRHPSIIETAAIAARRAGLFTWENFEKIGSIERKADRTFVTNLDKEAEAMIVEEIRRVFPDHAIMGEEGGTRCGGSDYLWVIDPIDGTHNLMRGMRIFGVSIGVVRQGEFIAGAVYMPADAELYVAEKGGGAYKNGARISVSNPASLADCSVSYDSTLCDPSGMRIRIMDALAHCCFNLRMFGSSARILTYVAEGKLDAAVEFDDKPWDFAAGACLVAEARGVITTPQGAALQMTRSGYIAAHPQVHAELLRLVKRLAQEDRQLRDGDHVLPSAGRADALMARTAI